MTKAINTFIRSTLVVIITYYSAVTASFIGNTKIISARVIVVANNRIIFTTRIDITDTSQARRRWTGNRSITTSVIRRTTISGTCIVIITINGGVYTQSSLCTTFFSGTFRIIVARYRYIVAYSSLRVTGIGSAKVVVITNFFGD